MEVNEKTFAELLKQHVEILQRLDSLEANQPKAERAQPVVRQQDAALDQANLGRSAAGNPDGDQSLEAFKKWCMDECERVGGFRSMKTLEDQTRYDAMQCAMRVVGAYRRQGAA